MINTFFRKLTDKPKDEPTPAVLTESIENLEELGKGNNSLLPLYDNYPSNQLNKKRAEKSIAVENIKSEPQCMENIEEGGSELDGHMVMHKGALIDVDKLLQQLNRSEKAREETELRLAAMTKSHNDLQSSNIKFKDKFKDLQSELKSSNRKVSDSESSLSSANVSTVSINLYMLI